jgi:integrase/recombinase XerD
MYHGVMEPRVYIETTIPRYMRVSELITRHREDVVLGVGAHVRYQGKGRKQRLTPLRQEAVHVMKSWLEEPMRHPTDPLFPSSRGGPLSRDAVESLVVRHSKAAERRCASLRPCDTKT